MQTFTQALIELVRRRRGRPRGRGQRLDQPTRLPRRARPGAEARRPPASRPTGPSPRWRRSRPSRAKSPCPGCASPARTDEAARSCGGSLALALAGLGGTPTSFGVGAHDRRSASPAVLPSAETPNAPGSIALPGRAATAVRPSSRRARTPQLLDALAAGRRRLRRPVAGARRDQQDRVELRPQHGPELGRRDRLDAVHAVDLGALGRRRRRRRDREPVEPRRRDRRGGALPRGLRRRRPTSRARSSRYNHAQWYVDEVLQLAQLFGSGGVDATFNARPAPGLARSGARRRRRRRNRKLVEGASGAYARSRRRERGARRRRSCRHACSPTGSRSISAPCRPASSATPPRLASADFARARAGTRPDLASARDRSLASSFSPAAGSLLGAPGLRRRLRLPGRRRALARLGLAPPSRLSRGRHRRSGRLARLRARGRDRRARVAYPDGRCGIGLTMRTADGQSWTYCHLSYLDPAVTGASSSPPARQVGLVGSTGHATGPAPAPAARPDDLVPAAAAVVPALRGRRLPLAGRRPDRLRVGAAAAVFAVVHQPERRSAQGFGCPVHPVGG